MALATEILSLVARRRGLVEERAEIVLFCDLAERTERIEDWEGDVLSVFIAADKNLFSNSDVESPIAICCTLSSMTDVIEDSDVRLDRFRLSVSRDEITVGALLVREETELRLVTAGESLAIGANTSTSKASASSCETARLIDSADVKEDVIASGAGRKGISILDRTS